MHESQLRTLLLSFFPLNTGNWGGGEEETEMSTQKTGKANKKRKISKYKKKERSVIFSLLTLYTSFTFHHFMHFLLSHRHHHRHIVSYPIWNNFFILCTLYRKYNESNVDEMREYKAYTRINATTPPSS